MSTPTYAVLLRGINVGGHRKVSMAELREMLTELGHGNVETYLQSGNVLLTSGVSPEQLASTLTTQCSERFGATIEVQVWSGDQLAQVISGNPFPQAVENPRYFHVGFLSAEPLPTAVATLDPERYAPDEFAFGPRVMYLNYATGPGRSRLSTSAFAKLGVSLTARNWNTVLALAARCRARS